MEPVSNLLTRPARIHPKLKRLAGEYRCLGGIPCAMVVDSKGNMELDALDVKELKIAMVV